MNELVQYRQYRKIDVTVKSLSSSVIDSFLQSVNTISRKTIQSYRKNLLSFFSWLKSKCINAPRKEDVIAYKQELIARYKAATINSYLCTLRLLFRYLAENGLYKDLSCYLSPIKCTDQTYKKDALSKQQAQQLLSSITNLRDKAIITLMLTAGLRTVELSRANISDIASVNGEYVLYIQGKGRADKSEYVKLSSHTATAIKDYLQSRETANSGDPLFISESNHLTASRLTTDSISRIVRQYLIANNIKTDRITAHSLRHTAATLNLMAGGTLEETQTLLRHKSSSTTRIYTSMIERIKNQSEQRLDNYLFV